MYGTPLPPSTCWGWLKCSQHYRHQLYWAVLQPTADTSTNRGTSRDTPQVYAALSAAFASCHLAFADIEKSYSDRLLLRSISLYDAANKKLLDEMSSKSSSSPGEVQIAKNPDPGLALNVSAVAF